MSKLFYGIVIILVLLLTSVAPVWAEDYYISFGCDLGENSFQFNPLVGYFDSGYASIELGTNAGLSLGYKITQNTEWNNYIYLTNSTVEIDKNNFVSGIGVGFTTFHYPSEDQEFKLIQAYNVELIFFDNQKIIYDEDGNSTSSYSEDNHFSFKAKYAYPLLKLDTYDLYLNPYLAYRYTYVEGTEIPVARISIGLETSN